MTHWARTLPKFIRHLAVAVVTWIGCLVLPTHAETVLTIRQFIDQAVELGTEQEIELHGTVTAVWGDDGYFLQDHTGGIFAFRPGVWKELKVNDSVAVSGHPVFGGISPHFSTSLIQKLGKNQRPRAMPLNSENPPSAKFDAHLVRLTARVLNEEVDSSSREVQLHALGSTVLVQFVGHEDQSVWPVLHAGDLVEVVGVLSVRGSHDLSPYLYRVVLGSRSDVAFRSAAPWWMRAKAAQAIGFGGVLVMAALVWAVLLRRQVRHHTRQIRERFEKETAIERRYRELFESATDIIVTHDLDGRITSFNPAGERVLGWRETDLVGRPIESLMAPGETEIAGGLVQPGGPPTSPNGPSFHLELQTRDGRTVPFEVNSWIEYQDGDPVGVQAICRDISQRLRAEEEKDRFERKLQETQKLESLGILAGGIAHDFNNLLTAVLGNASLARLELPIESPAQKSIEEIELAAERAAELCSQMLAYSGQGRFVVSKVNITNLVMETLELIQASVSKRAKLELHLSDCLPAVQGDATQLRQIVMNLVINAGEALGDGPGTVTVRTGLIRADSVWQRDAQIIPEVWEGDYVLFEVTDTGCGMNPETLERIFEPFFTTKFTGRGLGLAAVLGIVRSHRGALRVTTHLGQGSTFAMALPAVGVVHDYGSPAMGDRETPALHGTVLVVDDEAPVRRTVTRVLETLGCKVIAAEDGTVALDRVRGFARHIDLVLLDLTMPQMDGVQTLRELRRLRPDLPVVLMSGFAEAHAVARFGEHRLSGFLQKPFTLDDVRRRVTAILAQTSPELALF